MERLSAVDAERILAAALTQPAGTDLVFGALSKVPGVAFEPGREGGRFRSATQPTLRVGDWTFSPVEQGTALEAGHTVRGVVLSRTTVAATEAAAKLAPAVLEAARQQGEEAQEYAQSVFGALGELLGL
ncbi:MAG TPA: DUF5073 family protein [Frankiaceae bacterium]|jgi:hypothetical protein|nr:DUF5073 family protein [Frankiaceae bacterium]